MPYTHNLKSLALTSSALCLVSSLATADIVHLDDVIVSLSLCVGQDCVNGESFGFDTIRLKENNLRIRAVDTSSTSSFPSNDWQITFNDSANGGANKFSIDDIDGGRTPFTIEAGTPSNALYVENDGDTGFGTSNPVVNLHVVDGNTPTLRLEQNGSSGFTPQTWDVAGNEANFFVRDATNGSKLPLKIKPGAPTSSIFVAADGDIGLGTESPTAALHVLRASGAADTLLELQNNKNPVLRFNNTNIGDQWQFSAGNSFLIQDVDGATTNNVFTLTEAGDLTLTGDLTTGGSGACNAGCDRVFSDDYDLLTIEEHADQMWANSYLPNVGPTPEDAPFNVSEKVGRILNELEHAHIYIAQLEERLSTLEAEVQQN